MWNSDQRASSLRQLHALNGHFISQLLAADENDIAGPRLAQGCIAELRALDAAALHEVCATPYTLYYLPFGNSTYWQETARLSAQRSMLHSGDSLASQHLAKLALFLAWHVASTDAAAARLFFGMSSETLEFFRGADVATLSGVAEGAAQVLQPRWHDNPYFWPELIQSARNNRIRLHAARLLGTQLLAAELHGEHVLTRASRRMRVAALRRMRMQPRPVGIVSLDSTGMPEVAPI